MQPLFSVVLIARNEEKTLPRLLDSLGEFQSRGGEIILVDTGSTDKTVEVARSRGVKVTEVGKKYLHVIDKDTANEINRMFVKGEEPEIVKEGDTLFDFAAARNFAAVLSSNNMIATPDCDEVYTKMDIDAVNDAIAKGAEQLEYNFVYSHDEHGGELIKFKHCKFYDKSKLSWVGIIHEVLSGNANRVFLEESVIKLEHWQNQETNRSGYLKGLALDCFLNRDNDRNSHYFARELFYKGHLRSSMAEFERHIEMNRWPTERSESMNYLGRINLMMGNKEGAFGWFMRAFDIEPRRREPLMYLADFYFQQNLPDHALVYAAAALQINEQENFYANFQPFYEQHPHEILYWALHKKGDYWDSKKHFDICLGYQPLNPKYLHDLRFYTDLPLISFVIPTLGRPEGLKRCVDSIKNLNYPQDKIEIIISYDEEKDFADAWEKTWNKDTQITVVINSGGRTGVPKTLARGVKQAKGKWIVYAANDIEFTPDSLIIALKTAQDNGKRFVSFNTGDFGEEKGNQCEHFMIHHGLLPKINNEIFDTEFHHVGVDALLWAQMEKLGQAMRAMKAIVIHHHFSRPGGGEMDEVNKIAWQEDLVKKDRELLQKKLLILNETSYGNGSEEFTG